MDTGELLTRATIWLALTLYVAGEAVKSFGCESERTDEPPYGPLPPHPALSPTGGEGVRRTGLRRAEAASSAQAGEGVVQGFKVRTSSRKYFRASRWLNTIGCAAFLAHVAAAFHFYHHWSHAAAYADTARQTAAFSGWDWGGGLFINYAFALVWLAEVFWAWANPNGFRRRASWLTWSIRGFFLFMIFNGAVVFVSGGMKWFGLILCFALVFCWWRKRRVDPPDPSQPI